jgi:hypothetical protein
MIMVRQSDVEPALPPKIWALTAHSLCAQNPGMVSLMELLLESDSRVVFTLLSVVDLAFNQAIPEAIIRIHEVRGGITKLARIPAWP